MKTRATPPCFFILQFVLSPIFNTLVTHLYGPFGSAIDHVDVEEDRASQPDKEIFIVEDEVMLQVEIIKNMIEGGCNDSEIPALNMDRKTLTKVIEYLTKHAHNKDFEDADLKAWDVEFVNVDPNTLYDLMMAANYLCIRSPWDLLLNTLTYIIKGRSVEEICKTFRINNDFTPEEEEELRKESP